MHFLANGFAKKNGALNSDLVFKANQIADGIWLGLGTILASVEAMASVTCSVNGGANLVMAGHVSR